MGNGATEYMELLYHCNIKVHRLMCLELKKLIDRISCIFSAIESARPRCTSGIQALCSVHVSVDKANLLIQHSSECSKLYLAITSDRIQLRCEKIRNTLVLCLSQIQNMVPSLFALEISKIVDGLKSAQFLLEPSEHEAGAALLALLRQGVSTSGFPNKLEIEALQLAALRLNISSPLAFLIEKRSIERLLDKVHDKDLTKKKILKYFLYLLRKYRQLNRQPQSERILPQLKEPYYDSVEPEGHVNSVEDGTQTDDYGTLVPLEDFKCPISMRLLYDPVVIASGKTFERVWIEKWFNEGYQTCPVTHMSLEHFSLTPNLAMKGLITKWCLRHGITTPETYAQPIPSLLALRKTSSSSVASFGSSMDDLHLQVSNVSFHASNIIGNLDSSNGKENNVSDMMLPQMNADSHRYQFSKSGSSITLASLLELHSLSWGPQCKAVENVKEQLKHGAAYHLMFSNGCIQQLIKYLKDAHDLHDVKAQKDGAEVILALLRSSRFEMPTLQEDVISVLASLLDSEITGTALSIIEVLSCQQCYKSGIVASGLLPPILKVLDNRIREFQMLAMKILCNLCSNSDTWYHIVYLDCVPKLVALLSDPILAGYCIEILKNLCNTEEVRVAVVESNLCITSIAKLLETGTKSNRNMQWMFS